MKLLDKIGSWITGAMRRKRLGIFEPKSGEELWYTYLSPVGLALAMLALLLILFIATLTIVAYTPILNFLPGYRSNVVRSRESLVENIMRLDSLERVISDVMIYNENVSLIMDGKSPVVRDLLSSDSLKVNKALISPTSADSLLRYEMSQDASIAKRASYQQRVTSGDAVALIAPSDGHITTQFDLRDGHFGIQIEAVAESRILAVGDGIVLSALWSPSSGYSVELLHSGGMISIYNNLSHSLVVKGQLVKNGEVIGFAPAADSPRLFEFELWSGGKPANPEEFILFN